MTKQQLIDYLDQYDEDDEISADDLIRFEEETRERVIDEIEERQHQSGFYAFQDTLDMYRRER